jgi:hypothetical protein
VLTQLGLLASTPGPTATKLLEQYSASSIDSGNIDEVQTDLYAFAPTYNAMALTWESLFVDYERHVDGQSDICSRQPHVLCDSIASLDDPNHMGFGDVPVPWLSTPEHQPAIPYDGPVDWTRSVHAWEVRPIVWRPGYIGPERECRLGYTAFTHAMTGDTMDVDYIPTFKAPGDCSFIPEFAGFDDPERPWTSTGAAPLINTENRTQGTGSLQIQGCGFQTLGSPWHMTTEWGTIGHVVDLDVFVPSGTATQYWAGDLELLVTVRGQVYNSWSIGNQQLTGLPRDTWSTVSFVIPDVVYQAYLGDYADASFDIKVNWPDCAADKRLLLDNLRWGDEVPTRRTIFHQRGSQVRSVATTPVLGFENANEWNTSVPHQTVTTPVVEGARALQVSAQWYTPITSVGVSTNELAEIVSPTMSLDVKLPDPDAFPDWTGDVQLYVSCAGTSLQNSPIGSTVPLTHRFDGEYNTLYFQLSQAQIDAMATPNGTCQFTVALNVTPGTPFVLDNLGFIYE